MKRIIRNLLEKMDISIHHRSRFEDILRTNYVPIETWLIDINFCSELGREIGSDLLDLMQKSKSQLRQDIFALHALGFMRNGFFVEFGAADGITLSNTYLLEKEFRYRGILAEPSPKQRKNIAETRSAAIESKCVWSETGKMLDFIEVGDFSTVGVFSDVDTHAEVRKNAPSYSVETISLVDMLKKHNAPKDIEYLSIDTEGSEYEILSAHDFSEYSFKVITCEHNFTDKREKIHDLLRALGYVRKFETLSKFDDWYVRS